MTMDVNALLVDVLAAAFSEFEALRQAARQQEERDPLTNPRR